MARRRDPVVKHIVLIAVILVVLSSVASALKPKDRHGGGTRRRKKQETTARQGRKEELVKQDIGERSAGRNDTAYLLNFTTPPTLLNNNIGGIGPNESANFMSLVIGNVAKIRTGKTDTPVSLVLYNTTYYDPRASVEINGITEIWYPTISVYAGTNVTMRGIFVNSETGQRTKLSSFTLSVLNLDAWIDGSGEQQIIFPNKFEKYTTSGPGSSVKCEKMDDGRTSFMATFQSAAHETPVSPLLMEPNIFAGSIALFWKDVEEIEFTLQVKNLGNLTKDESKLSHSRRYFFATIPTQISSGSDAFGNDVQSPGGTSDDSGGWLNFLLLFLLVWCLICCCCAIIGCVIFEIKWGSGKIQFGSPFNRDPGPGGPLHHGHI